MSIHYKIISKSPERLVLQENTSTSWIIAIVIGILGGLAFALGLVGLSAEPMPAESEQISWIMTFMGGAFLLSVLVILDARNDNPKELIFDNALQELHIHQKTDKKSYYAVIPYKDIKGFLVRRVARGSGKSKQTGYTVYMQKTDMSLWSLNTFNHLGRAEVLHQEIEQFFERRNDLVYSPSIIAEFPSKVIQRYEYADKVEMRWRNKIHIRKIALLGIIACFWGIIIKVVPSESYIGFILFSAVLTLISGIILYNLFLDLTTTYGIEISKTGISSLRNKRTIRTIGLQDVAVIGFDFSDQVGGKPLRVMTNEQQQALSTMNVEDGISMSEIGTAFRLATSMWQINIDRLDVVGRINLEHFIEQDLKKYGAKHVK